MTDKAMVTDAYAAATVDDTGCEYLGRDVSQIEAIAKDCGSEVIYLFPAALAQAEQPVAWALMHPDDPERILKTEHSAITAKFMAEENKTCEVRALVYASPSKIEPVGKAGTMPGTNGFTTAVFKAEDVPVGTDLYVHPPAKIEAGENTAEIAQPPVTHLRVLDWSNFDGPKRNVEWTPDDQDLIYTALNYRDDDYGDADEDVGQQLVERLLAAWKRTAEGSAE